ncbi:MAG: hypothetical protein O2890_06850 [Cyanobacteria bacterium]|nr:hypothetical protein [Cyanobacteriota bacterium]MDA0866123.1 hypothetical protein [Cyanobacteriota bacterium]
MTYSVEPKVEPKGPAFQVPAAPSTDTLRIILVGSPQAVQNYVMTHHQWGYAEAIAWSPPLPTPHPGQIMRILTKRLHLLQPTDSPEDLTATH